jgi:hypothetical protein
MNGIKVEEVAEVGEGCEGVSYEGDDGLGWY